MLPSLLRPAAVAARSVAFRMAASAAAFSTKDEATTSAIVLPEKELMDGRAEIEAEKSKTQRRVEAMTKVDPYMISGDLIEEPDPELPENPAEISALDPAHRDTYVAPDGSARMVTIRQPVANPGQAPTNPENKWIIDFMAHGEAGENWDNPLMGWVSGADPVSQVTMQMEFDTASEAVYFAKKKGWNYIVDEPIVRLPRDDGAQYQDNFLPQAVAAQVQAERTTCKHWERKSAGTSHYMRPLKYHGDGEVTQYGPNGDQAPAPHVDGYYKSR